MAYCAECGAKRNPLGNCAMSAEHDVEQGGFACPGCGTLLDATQREGTTCLACRSAQ